MIFARELGRRYGDKVVSTACNPGNLHTSLRRHMAPWQVSIVVRRAPARKVPRPTRFEQNFMMLYPAEKGALTQLYAATAPEGEDLNGKAG